jgi:formate dehydrogenase subunit gamma
MASGAIERFDDEARQKFEGMGKTTVYQGELFRHPVYTRVLHWTVALFFFLALLSGFALYMPALFHWITPMFGGGPLTRILHPYFGIGFVICFSLQVLNWLHLMLWTPADWHWMRNIPKVFRGEEKVDPPDTGFFNAGQKAEFWLIVVACILFVITGIVMWLGAQTFGGATVAVSYILHDLSAIVIVGGIILHIYLSTIGEPGTFHAMTRGAVSEAWAWTFHPAWFKQVTGRDPVQACDEARREMETKR